MPPTSKIDRGLSVAMRDSLRAYCAGSERFFSFVSDKVRVYTVEDATRPIVGRKAFQKAFGSALTSMKRKVDVLHSDIQVTGDQAILAQTLAISAKGVTSHVRQSVVWSRDADGAWRMSHIHNGLVGTPVVAPSALRGADPVRVLNERIATVAATVGMAQ